MRPEGALGLLVYVLVIILIIVAIIWAIGQFT